MSAGRSDTRPRWAGAIALLAILLFAFSLRVYRLDYQGIWWDEGHSIQMAQAPPAEIASQPGMDVHPPGYFYLLHFWMGAAGHGEFALRYLSLAWGVLFVALAYRFGRELGDSRAGAGGIIAALFAAIYPLHVAYSQEVRMYTMAAFWALASVFSLWRVTRRGANRVDGTGYVVATAALLYTHYFSVFLLAFENVAFGAWAAKGYLRERSWRRAAAWVGMQAGVLLLFAPQILLASRQIGAYANPNLAPPTAWEFVRRCWAAYTVGQAVGPGRAGAWMIAAAVVLVGGGVLAAFRGNGEARTGMLFLAGWFILPLAMYFAVLQSRPSFEPRYMIVVTPALLLFAAWSFARLRGLRAVQVIACAVLCAAFAVGLWGYFYDEAYYKDDSGALAEWLAGNTTPRDIVYVDVPHPMHYYAERIPAPTRYLFVDVHTAADVLTAEAAGRERVFWVTWRGSDTDPRGVIRYLLEKHASLEGEKDFRGYHVAWYRLPPDLAAFSLPDDLAPANVVFGGVIALEGVSYSDEVMDKDTGKAAWAVLRWRLPEAVGIDYRVSLRLRGVDGAVVAQDDRDVLNDVHLHTSAWNPRDDALNNALNVYMLPVSADAPPGEYALECVVYDAATLAPLPVTSGADAPDGVSARIGSVVVGGDGRIAFVSDRDGNSEIYLMGADGSGLTNLTNSPASDGFPSWSPDGERIAFVSDRDGNPEIYVMRADGTGVARLTDDPTVDTHPAWSPDGRQIAFASYRDGAPEIYSVNPDGGGVTNLTDDPAWDEFPSWLPDGRLSFVSTRVGYWAMHVMDADGGNVTHMVNTLAVDEPPVWSPDGKRYGFVSHCTGDHEVYVRNADNLTGEANLTQSAAADRSPSWSPDGERIAFSSNRDGNWEIYVMGVDGGGVVRLTDDPAEDSHPAWSPR